MKDLYEQAQADYKYLTDLVNAIESSYWVRTGHNLPPENTFNAALAMMIGAAAHGKVLVIDPETKEVKEVTA